MFQPDAHELKIEFDKTISRYRDPEAAIGHYVERGRKEAQRV